MASFRKRGCKCKKNRKCTCGATWSFVIDIGKDPVTGKRRQKEFYGYRTKAEAIDASATMRHEVKTGLYVVETEKTFEEFASEWIKKHKLSGDLKPNSVRLREYRVKMLMSYLCKAKMKDITLIQYQHALNDLYQQGYAHGTIAGINITGNQIFEEALRQGILRKNLIKHAYVPKKKLTVEELEQEEIPKYLEKDELNHFFAIAMNQGLHNDYITFLTLAFTGLRIGELVALKWSDFDAIEKTLSITKSYYNKTNSTTEFELDTTKTKTSRRIVDIDKTIVEELKKHETRQKEIKMKFRKHYQDNDFIFAETGLYAGFPVMPVKVRTRMKRLLKLAGLNTSLSPHSLRHTHTSLLAEAGADLDEIMYRLGHKSDAITRNIYLHITKARKKKTAQIFEHYMTES